MYVVIKRDGRQVQFDASKIEIAILKAMNFTLYEVEGFDCPAIAELPIALTCKVFDIVPLGCHDMFMADITGVIVNEDLLDEKGRLEIE